MFVGGQMSSLIDKAERKRQDEIAKQLGWWPASELAKCFGVSEQHVRRLARIGILPGPNEQRKYPAFRCIRAYLDYSVQAAVARREGRRVVDDW
jgi:hypothetical protein